MKKPFPENSLGGAQRLLDGFASLWVTKGTPAVGRSLRTLHSCGEMSLLPLTQLGHHGRLHHYPRR